MNRKLIIAIVMTSMLIGCKSKEKATDQQNGGDVSTIVEKKELPTMPEGRLLRVTYYFQGMRMPEFGNFDLKRSPEGSRLFFKHYNSDASCEVSDTLFDAVRNIIEQEKMYEYDSYYSFKTDERILDGYRWEFEAWFEGDKRISSGGRHVSPSGKGLQKIDSLLSEAARQAMQADKQP